MAKILFLDEDHVLKLARFALSGTAEVEESWVRAFFAPEIVDPADVYAAGEGLHPGDGVSLLPPETAMTAESSEAEIVVTRRGTVTAALMDAHPRLRLVQRLGERSDPIDLEAAAARGIAVSCLPRQTLIYTAEHSILLMLALSKRLVEADSAVRSGAWDRAAATPTDGVAYNWVGLSGLSGLFGRTLGIIGLGEVGTIVAGLARAFGMSVVYTNRNPLPAAREESLGVRYLPQAELLAAADFVSVNAANLPENRGLIDAAMLGAMKPGAVLINTSRGKLVDEDALYEALTGGRLGGAGLDVHWEEPRLPQDRFTRLPNVILTPHCAGGSRRGIMSEVGDILANCRSALNGGAIRHRVGAGAVEA